MAERSVGRSLGIGALLLLAAAASILAQGFALPSGINAYHWPILFGWVGSPEGPQDPFIESLAHFVSAFWPTLGLVVDEANAAWLLTLVHLFLRFLLVLALFLILDRLTQGRRLAARLLAMVLPIGLAFYIESPLGHGEVLLDNLSHSSANPPLALLIFYFAMTRRWLAAGALLGLLFNVNAFVAAWVGLGAAFAFILSERDAEGPQSLTRAVLRRGLPAAALALLIAAPTVWRIWQTLQATAPQLPDYDFRDFLRAYYPDHFFPDATGAGGWLLFVLMMAGFAWLWVKLPSALAEKPLAVWRGLVFALAVVVIFGIALPTLSGNRLLLNAHPLRMDFLLVWLFLLGLAFWSLARERLEPGLLTLWLALFGGFWTALALLLPLSAGDRDKPRPLLALWFAALAVAIVLASSLPASPLGPPRLLRAFDLLLLLPLLALAFPNARERFWPPCLGFLAAMSFAAAESAPWLAAAALLLPLPALLPWRKREAVARHLHWLYLPLALAAAWLARGEPRIALLLLAGTLVPPALAYVFARGETPRRLGQRFAPAALVLAALVALWPGARHLVVKGRLDRYDSAALAFLDVQRWARDATPADSVFLVPESQLVPNLVPSFWTLSRRSAWVDWRMGAGAHWQPDFYWYWSERLAAARALLSDADKLAFADHHAIDYVILERDDAPEGATLAYQNDHYVVVSP